MDSMAERKNSCIPKEILVEILKGKKKGHEKQHLKTKSYEIYVIMGQT